LGSEPANDTNDAAKRIVVGTIKRDSSTCKFVIRQYESTGYDFDDGNCRGEN